MNEGSLITQAQAGDGEALGQLLQARQDKLYRTAFLYVHNQTDALDVIQETALQAMLSIKKLRQPEFFDTWLIRILINSAYRLLRHQKNTELADMHQGTTAARPELHWDLLQDLNKLSPKLRDVLILYYFNDLSLHEVAQVLHIPTGTVKSRIARGLQRMREEGDVIHEYRFSQSH